MPHSSSEPSAALLEAQTRLLQLRAQLGIEMAVPPQPQQSPGSKLPVDWARLNAEAELHRRRQMAGIGTSDRDGTERRDANAGRGGAAQPAAAERGKHKDIASTRTFVAHPTLLLELLKQQLEAPGRIYFLMRALDQQGRGWLMVEDAREQLTRKGAPWKVCGWRRLRQLLHQGEGIFWRRDGRGRLWLRGLHWVAYTLDLIRLQGYPVELPITALLGGIQGVRAAFYAAFHGGRDSKPISRDTLTEVSGLSARTQHAYERIAGVDRRRNLAIGERYTAENAQERAWQRGRAVFSFIDAHGRQGRKNARYIAWHLPNSYRTAYDRRSRGSRKRLNRKLKDLLMKGITGNVGTAVERLFFPNGALAAKRFNRAPEADAYWLQGEARVRRASLWAVLAGHGG